MDHSEKGEKESQAVRLHDDKNDHLLLNLLSPPERCDVDRMSSTDLAYIGDVVYEMLVRSKKVWPPKRTSDLQQQVVKMVRGTLLLANYVVILKVNDRCAHPFT